MSAYSGLKIDELRKVAAEMKIKGFEKLKKAELLKYIEDAKEAVETAALKKPAEKKAEHAKEVREAKPLQKKESANKAPETPFEKSAEKEERPTLRPHVENGDSKKQQLFDVNAAATAVGVFELLPDGFGFLRSANLQSGNSDIYVSPALVRKYGLRTGDMVAGYGVEKENEKFGALVYIKTINGENPADVRQRKPFEALVPIYPQPRISLENAPHNFSMRLIDIICPIGKGQRGLIVSPPKAGKTTLLKNIAQSISLNHPDITLMVLLIDERPEEVTDIVYSVEGADVIYSTFDMPPENHTKVAEMALERAMRLVEQKKDVVILLDSLTRLARAYNLTVQATGRTLSGGLEVGALHKPKKFFGAARKIKDGGSLTILATALVDTGSRMDDVIYEEFKGTGNMELHLDRSMSERRIFPALDIYKSGTRKEELLLSYEELSASYNIRRAFGNYNTQDVTEYILNRITATKTNVDFVEKVNKELAKDSKLFQDNQ